MVIDRAESGLDLGCGTGVAAHVIAARTDFAGTVLGIDLSPHLIAAAEQLAPAMRVSATGCASGLATR